MSPFALELPDGIQLDGAIRWQPIADMIEDGNVVDEGIRLKFYENCQEQFGLQPLIMGRVPFRVTPEFREGEIQVVGHSQHHLRVQLCDGKFSRPRAEGLRMTVRRKLSFWDKMKELFR